VEGEGGGRGGGRHNDTLNRGSECTVNMVARSPKRGNVVGVVIAGG
jgi:hypothetical protein